MSQNDAMDAMVAQRIGELTLAGMKQAVVIRTLQQALADKDKLIAKRDEEIAALKVSKRKKEPAP